MGCLSRQLQRFTRTAMNHIIDLSSEGLPDGHSKAAYYLLADDP